MTGSSNQTIKSSYLGSGGVSSTNSSPTAADIVAAAATTLGTSNVPTAGGATGQPSTLGPKQTNVSGKPPSTTTSKVLQEQIGKSGSTIPGSSPTSTNSVTSGNAKKIKILKKDSNSSSPSNVHSVPASATSSSSRYSSNYQSVPDGGNNTTFKGNRGTNSSASTDASKSETNGNSSGNSGYNHHNHSNNGSVRSNNNSHYNNNHNHGNGGYRSPPENANLEAVVYGVEKSLTMEQIRDDLESNDILLACTPRPLMRNDKNTTVPVHSIVITLVDEDTFKQCLEHSLPINYSMRKVKALRTFPKKKGPPLSGSGNDWKSRRSHNSHGKGHDGGSSQGSSQYNNEDYSDEEDEEEEEEDDLDDDY